MFIHLYLTMFQLFYDIVFVMLTFIIFVSFLLYLINDCKDSINTQNSPLLLTEYLSLKTIHNILAQIVPETDQTQLFVKFYK